jgi:hypothetical protein
MVVQGFDASKPGRHSLLDEVIAVWLLLLVMAIALVVTYARLPPEELYNVSDSGIIGAFGRLLVDLNFPDAIVALAILAVVWRELPRRAVPFAVVAAALCLVVAVPGVVDQDDLDAKWINAVPAVGVLIVLVLSLATRRQPPVRHARGDLVRIVIASVAVAVAIPWIAAALGFFLDGAPALGSIFQTERVVSFHGNEPHHAVHHGMHHGLYGLVLIVSALLLSRRLRLAPRIAAALLALLLAYGIGNIVNDDWLEQIAERGWTDGTFPSVLEPAANWGWLAVLVAAAATWAVWFRQEAAARTASS